MATKKKKAPAKGDMHFVDIEPQPQIVEAPDDMAITLAQDPVFRKFEIAKRIAHTLSQSTLVPPDYQGDPNNCFVAINMGAEVGLEPFQAIQSIAVINGRPCLYGDGLIAVVRASDLCMWITEGYDEETQTATCATHRKGDPQAIVRTFSMDDAKKAQLLNKQGPWKNYPLRMLQMRARAWCLRDAYPDLLKGLRVVEEVQDYEPEGVITEYELPSAPAQVKVPTEALPENQAEGGDPDPNEMTLAKVERAMHDSKTLEALLKAANDAKELPEMDQKTARVTYAKVRKAILDRYEREGVAQSERV